MSVIRCFTAKVRAGRVTGDIGQRYVQEINQRAAERETRMTRLEAARAAAAELQTEAAFAAERQADLAVRTIEAQIGVLDVVADYRQKVETLRATPGDFGRGSKVPFLLRNENASPLGPAIRAMLARDFNDIATTANVHYLARDIRGRAHATFAQSIEAFRPKFLGLKREDALDLELGRAIVDGRSDSGPAMTAAAAWKAVDTQFVAEANAAGMSISARDRYLPVHHDADKVAAVSRDAWKSFVTPRLDRTRMMDWRSGQPMDDVTFNRVLDTVYDSITARGAGMAPSEAFRGEAMLANQRQDARVLEWKSFDDWNAYRETFGPPGGVWDTLMTHVQQMADDIALLRVFGPNPDGTMKYIDSLFDQERAALRGGADMTDAAGGAAGVKAIRKAVARLNADQTAVHALYDTITGRAAAPVNMELAHAAGTMRAALSGAQMGSAIISSITDAPLTMMTARFNGLPAMSIIREATAMMANRELELTAAQAGLVADSLAHGMRENDRFMGEAIGNARVAQISSAAIRASGLRRWSASLRNAFGMEFMAHAARMADRDFGALDPRFREAFERYGIDAGQWDVIRRTEIWEPRTDARFIRPMDVRRTGTPEARAAGENFMRLITTEIDHAVIESDPTTQALLYRGTRPGTAEGELLRAVGMYKQFPVTFVTLHMNRMLARGWDGSRLGHSALTLVAMWGFGILAMQMKQVANGKDPYDLDPTTLKGARAWGAGLLQSGGLGIFGDLLFTDKTRQGNSFATTLAGPQFAAVEDVLGNFLMKNLGRAAKGEETHFAGDALYTAARYLPGSNLFYARQAFQRAIVDQLALQIDDRAPERFRRIEREAMKNWDQEFWWRPGQSAPDRAPAIGGSP